MQRRKYRNISSAVFGYYSPIKTEGLCRICTSLRLLFADICIAQGGIRHSAIMFAGRVNAASAQELFTGLFVVLFGLLVTLPVEHLEVVFSAQREARIGDRKPHLQKARLVCRLDREGLIGISRTVYVSVRNLARQPEATYHLVRIFIQVLRVGLEIDPPVLTQVSLVAGRER